MNKKHGFTLLELLVVVGIIAILSAIVILSLNSARSRGGDASVKSNLHSVRNQAGIFFANNNSFLPAGGVLYNDACPISGTSNMFSADNTMKQAIAKAVNDGGLPGNGLGADPSWCYNSATVWAVAVSLKSNSDYSWCVDAAGKSKQVNSVPELSIDSVTHLCK